MSSQGAAVVTNSLSLSFYFSLSLSFPLSGGELCTGRLVFLTREPRDREDWHTSGRACAVNVTADWSKRISKAIVFFHAGKKPKAAILHYENKEHSTVAPSKVNVKTDFFFQ